MIAKRLGKKRIIAETGAGQHGVATAAVAARFGLKCTIYMGAKDCERQRLNVFRMRLMGAEVKAVTAGTQVLEDAVAAAFQDLAQNLDTTFYLVGSAVGPYPYPQMVERFQRVISREARQQFLDQVGRLIGAEGAGKGADTSENAATLTNGKVGINDGMKSYVLQDDEGQVLPAYSISAGLDYPGIGPVHSFLKDSGRAEYYPVTDDEAVAAFKLLSETEGIIPALESSNALAQAIKMVPEMAQDQVVMVNLSGRGDKDVAQVAAYLGEEI